MGGTWSHENATAREKKSLIGDFSKLSPAAQRLYDLGNKCLESVDPNAANRHALRALDTNADPTQNHASTTAGDATEASDQKDADGASDTIRPLFEPLQQTMPLFHQQTFTQWRSVRELKNVYSFCMPSQSVIYIQPIDEFPDFILNFRFKSHGLYMDFFGLLQSFAQVFFNGYDVVVLPQMWLDTCGWYITSREHSVTRRKQYLGTDFLKPLQTMMPSGGSGILGLVWTDLYSSRNVDFEMGESSPEVKAGIFCFGRFEPNAFNPTSPSDVDKITGALVWKMMKVCVSVSGMKRVCTCSLLHQ